MNRRQSILLLGLWMIFLGLCLTASAQQAPGTIKTGMGLYERKEYFRALYFLLKAYSKNSDSRLIIPIADCYRQTRDYSNAEVWFKKAMVGGPVSSTTRLLYGDALQLNGKYLAAIKQLLLAKPSSDSLKRLVEEKIYSCQQSDSLARLPNRYQVIAAADLNSSEADFGLVPYGKGFLFLSDRSKGKVSRSRNDRKVYGWTGRSFLHMYSLPATDSLSRGLVVPFDSLTLPAYHQGPMVFNKTQNTVYFTLNRPPVSDQIWRLGLYYSHKVNGHWSSPKPLGHSDKKTYSDAHPALSTDEHFLYFSSDRPGGLGGIDLYAMEILANDQFGDAVNVGPSINTPGDEEFPVFAPDGDLYFSSNGHFGLGGLDVYRTRGSKNHWLVPQNLGPPINTSNDDFDFIVDGHHQTGGYFSSNRAGGRGSDDIYRFLQISPLAPVRRFTGDHSLLDSMEEVSIQIRRFSGDSLAYLEEYGMKPLISKTPADSVTTRTKLLASFLHSKSIYHLTKTDNAFNQFSLDQEAMSDIDSLAKVLKAHPGLTLAIIGHSDSRGSGPYNLRLSKKRAKAVFDRFVFLGIDPKRLKATGVGSTQLVNHCRRGVQCTEQEHAANRKTEFKVVGVGDSFAFDDAGKVISTDTSYLANRIALEEIAQKQELRRATEKASLAQRTENQGKTLTLDQTSVKKLGLLESIERKSEAIHHTKEKLPPPIELFDAFGEMAIDTLYVTSRNILVIREKDGTVQRVFLPASLLRVDQSITDLNGTRWLIGKDRQVTRLKSRKK